MSIVSEVRLITDYRPEAPDRAKQQWLNSLLANAQSINDKRKARIPDSTAFVSLIAQPSMKGYSSVLNPAFHSKSGLSAAQITANQGANIKTAFEKYQAKLDFLFETVDGVPAKRYKDLINQAADAYSKGVASRTLPFTGCKIEGIGLTAIATRWLTADVTTEGFLRGGDSVLAGGPYLICPPAKKPGLKAMLNQRLIQAGANIVKSAYSTAVMTAENQLTAEQIQGFVDPGLDIIPFVGGSPDSHVDYVVLPDGQLYLSIKVSKM